LVHNIVGGGGMTYLPLAKRWRDVKAKLEDATEEKILANTKVKDVDATPVDDVLLKVVDGVLQLRTSADDAYRQCALDSLPPIPNTQLIVGTGYSYAGVGAGGEAQFTLNDYSFAPNWGRASTNVYFRIKGFYGTYDDYIARFRVYNEGATIYVFRVNWRYISSSERVIILHIIDKGGNESMWISEPVRDENGLIIKSLSIFDDRGEPYEEDFDIYETEFFNVPHKPYMHPEEILKRYKEGVLKIKKIPKSKIVK